MKSVTDPSVNVTPLRMLKSAVLGEDREDPQYWVLMENLRMAGMQAVLDAECRAFGFTGLEEFLALRDAA
jgi:hypothetical protein